MNQRDRLVAAPVLAVLGVLALPGVARADLTKAQCIAANSSAQDLRRDRKLAEAREQLRICGDPSCPEIVRADCTKRLDELDAAQPTIVFDAKDGHGGDLTVVKVSIDNKPLVERLDGAALRVDPGEHTFTFEIAGQPPVSQRLVLKEGEKERHERIVIGGPAAGAPGGGATSPAPAVGASADQGAGGKSSQKWIGVGVAAAGVAGLAVGGVFGVLTGSAISQQKSDCASASSCSNYAAASSDHSTWTRDGTISTIAFVAGGVLLAGGALLFFTAPSSSETPAAATARSLPGPSLAATPLVGSGTAGVLLQGRF